jgi:dihydroorotase
MPNTDPVNDQAGITRSILEAALREGMVRVWPIGAITRGSKGEELAEYGDLREAGCVAVSDDGRPVASARVMRRALEYAKAFDLTVIDHCEEPTLSQGASMNEGPVATLLGLRGAPGAGEAIMVERDVLLAELTGGKVHIAHASTAASVDAVRRGKARGVRVTAEATPHHLLLTDELVRATEYDTSTKMNPPLRAEEDRQALIDGIRDGAVDCIATDHAPHTVDDKRSNTTRPRSASWAWRRRWRSAWTAWSRGLDQPGPARGAALHAAGGHPRPARRHPRPGAPADVTVLDLSRRQKVDPARFLSKSRNTPFGGWTLKGGPAFTIVGGRVAWRHGR